MSPWVVATSVAPAGADSAWLDAGRCVDCVDVAGLVVVVLAAVVGGAAVGRLECPQAGSSMQMAIAKHTRSRCRRLM
jgi:hypothetical protein